MPISPQEAVSKINEKVKVAVQMLVKAAKNCSHWRRASTTLDPFCNNRANV